MLTLSALDIINGGAGIDTLKVATNLATNIPLSNLSNVEIIEVQGAAAGGTTVDTTTLTGVTNLNITKTAGAINADAGAATDVSVALATAAATVVDGGKNVNVALTDAVNGSTVAVGGTLAAKGTVTVDVTGKASAANADVTLGTVAVTGGTTISVTQKATSNAAAAATDKVGTTITQGAVTVTGNAATTTVTVKQDASVAEVLAVDAVAAKAATQDVTFAAMTAGQTVIVDFGDGRLTFTANKTLTAAEAASAFANLAANAKQGNASAALGIYTDTTDVAAATGVTNGWTSGAVTTVSATEAKVTFTSATAATAITNGGGTVASVPGAYSGNAIPAVAAKTGVLGVTNGAVGVTDGANSIKTITVDGYGASTTTATTVLETLNLSNSGLTYSAVVGKVGQVTGAAGITVADTAATLALNLEKVGFSGYYNGEAAVTTQAGAVALTLAPATLNVKSTGNNYVNLTADLTETLNVSGTGLLNASTADLLALKTVKVTETAGLTLHADVANTVTSVDTTGTTGTVTISIEGNKATYTGGAGVDNVTVTNASTAISKAIDLGAGNDRLDLSATLAIDPTVEIKGGDGIDTIVLSAQAAHDRSAASTFEGKITGFEKLGIGSVAGAASLKVDMTNMDDINYVVSANTTTATAAANETGTYTFGALLDGQSITLAGVTVQAIGGGLTAIEVAEAFDSAGTGATPVAGHANAVVTGTYAGWGAADNAGAATVVYTSSTAATNVADLDTLDATAGIAAVVTANGAQGVEGTGAGATETATVTLGALLAGQSYTLHGIKIQAVSNMSSVQVATAYAAAFAGGTSQPTYLVSGVKTTPTNWGPTYTAANGGTATVTFTNANDADIVTTASDFNAVGNLIVAAPATGAQSAYTQGAAAGAVAAGVLVIDKLASNGTLELTAAGAGVEVKVTDATTGTADVLNIVANAATANANLGTVKAAGVETINITANDTDTTTAVNAITGAVTGNVSTNSLNLAADKAATVTVGGAGNLTLTLDATSTAVTLIDGSLATGKLNVTTLASDLAATTVKGGSAADILVAQGANDVLLGGAGNDTLKVMGSIASAVTLTGGDGVDQFDVSGFLAANAGAAATITDFTKGETIKFVSNANANFASSKVSLIAEATFDNYVTEAAKAADAASAGTHGLAWFQFGGNTFIVQDVTGDAAFTNNQDSIVKLTGLVDLSASSFNEVGQGTLLFI